MALHAGLNLLFLPLFLLMAWSAGGFLDLPVPRLLQGSVGLSALAMDPGASMAIADQLHRESAP